MFCFTLSSSGQKRKVHLPPLSMVLFLQILNMKSFPGRGCRSHGGCRGDKGAAFITSGMSLLISAAVEAALQAAPHLDGSLLLGWEKGCTTSVASHTFLCTSVTKCKDKKCNVFKMTFWIVKVSNSLSFSQKRVYFYAWGFPCPYCFVLQQLESRSPKRNRGMHPFIATSVEWGQLGKLTKGKWEGMKPRKILQQAVHSPLPGLFVQLQSKKTHQTTFTNGSNEVILLTFRTISKELFLHFHRGCFLKEILMKSITDIRPASAFTFPVSMELFQCC